MIGAHLSISLQAVPVGRRCGGLHHCDSMTRYEITVVVASLATMILSGLVYQVGLVQWFSSIFRVLIDQWCHNMML